VYLPVLQLELKAWHLSGEIKYLVAP